MVARVGKVEVVLGVDCQAAGAAEPGGGAGAVDKPGATRRARKGGHHAGYRINLADHMGLIISYKQVALAVAHHAIGRAKGGRGSGAVGGARRACGGTR